MTPHFPQKSLPCQPSSRLSAPLSFPGKRNLTQGARPGPLSLHTGGRVTADPLQARRLS